MHVETLDRRKFAEQDVRAIAELLCLVWPKSGRAVETRVAEMLGGWKHYCGPEEQFPRSLIVRQSGRVVAHAEMSPRTIGTSTGQFVIGALAGVCTHPSVRGQRLGVTVVQRAFQLIDDGVFSFSLFQNDAINEPFYRKLGARAIDNRIVNSLAEDPAKNPFWAQVAMVYPADKPWPSGDIDLRGLGY
jgi:Acetyltransferase (GNAT) domain